MMDLVPTTQAWNAVCQEGAQISRASFLTIELIVFALAFICIVHAWKRGREAATPNHRPLFTMVAIFIFTFVVELVLSSSENPIYCYPKEWLVMVLEVPLWIPLGWAFILYVATCTSEALGLEKSEASQSWWHLPLMNAFLALTLDFLLDPIAVMENWWVWKPGTKSLFFDIPVQNFMAWFVIVSSFAIGAQFFARKIPAGKSIWRDLLAPMLAIVPAFAAVAVYKVIANYMTTPAWGNTHPFYTNGVLISSLIWGVCAYLVFSRLYHFKRDKPLDKVVFFVPLGFYTLLLLFLVKNLYFDFQAGGVDGYNDYASLAVFMPTMAAVGMLLFAWPYLNAIFAFKTGGDGE